MNVTDQQTRASAITYAAICSASWLLLSCCGEHSDRRCFANEEPILGGKKTWDSWDFIFRFQGYEYFAHSSLVLGSSFCRHKSPDPCHLTSMLRFKSSTFSAIRFSITSRLFSQWNTDQMIHIIYAWVYDVHVWTVYEHLFFRFLATRLGVEKTFFDQTLEA